jgi:CoA-transferase family III
MDAGNSIPLASVADQALVKLARASGSSALATLDGATILGERAMRAGFKIPGRVSAGGGCRLFGAVDDTIALNLARAADREMLPALFETDELDTHDDAAIAVHVARADAQALLARGRSMGLAIAAENETPTAVVSEAGTIAMQLSCGGRSSTPILGAPRVVDLSALWAGPLAAHLLWLAGAEVVKVESRSRPDALQDGDGDFYALLNQGKTRVDINLAQRADRQALLSLIAASDIVIEAARPRALAQLGIDAGEIVRTTPGLVWISITGHGAAGETAGWVGFGDDCGVSGGLSAALRGATGRTGFVGDAIADPLTGIFAALAAWDAWVSRRGVRLGVAMSQVAARCLAAAAHENPEALRSCLRSWGRAAGQPFPAVRRRSVAAESPFCGDIQGYLARPRQLGPSDSTGYQNRGARNRPGGVG